MTKEQVMAIKAMMYAYINYGEKKLCHGEYTINPFTKDEVSIGFNKAYIICQEMINAESAKSAKYIWQIKSVIKDFKNSINNYSQDYKFSKEEVINILERYELKHNKTIIEADETESEE